MITVSLSSFHFALSTFIFALCSLLFALCSLLFALCFFRLVREQIMLANEKYRANE